ncbi:formin-like protein 1 isoform X3 [Hemicordylus capensis]|uniref:formin-like protein 1 isoform X3 n=1 Tax=Hemicordylus capensis TaxID=884348 RepID=UPI002303B092|nr:formin-like protein 1 isoform X3 [Hemicordylus capensis]
MGNAASSMEMSPAKEMKSQPTASSPLPPKQPATPKQPMPSSGELEERFTHVLNSMNLPPDKMKLLSQYDNEKKWELICDQERFQVKNPPSAYIQKLKSYLDTGGFGGKFKRRVQESTQVLRELEISLRTNYIGWVQEFLNEENKGLEVLVDYLAFAQCSVTYDMDSTDNGSPGSDKGKALDRSMEDLSRSNSSSPTQGSTKTRHMTVRCCHLNQQIQTFFQQVHPSVPSSSTPGSEQDSKPRPPVNSYSPRLHPPHSRKALRNSRIVSQKDDVHVCIMCLRAIMNYQSGFSLVMNHPACVNEITLSLNNKNPRTKALVLELLAAVCLVRGGHDIILAAFDNFKEVCGEKNRFEKLMEYFRNEESNIDFMVACMQFINIVVHSVEDMNFRVFLQYEFTHLGLDEYLEKLRYTESDKLQVQIQAYLDNIFDVSALLEDTETKNAVLEHVEDLQEEVGQLVEKLQVAENESMAKIAELEKQLCQSRRELEALRARTAEDEQPSQGKGEPPRPYALERKLEELEDKGLIRILRGSDGDAIIGIEVIPITVETTVTIETSSSTSTDFPSPSTSPVPSAAPEIPPPPPLPFTKDTSSMVLPASQEVVPPPPPPAPPLPLSSDPPPAPPLPAAGTTAPPPPPPPPLLSVDGPVPPPPPPPPMANSAHPPEITVTPAIKIKKPIQTKFRMPIFNWVALKPNQINGTVFNELNDEKVLQELDMNEFEEQFKTKAQGPSLEITAIKAKASQKAPSKVTIIESNRAKNLAITLRKGGLAIDNICKAIQTYDLSSLNLDFLELLMRFIPTEYELTLIRKYEKEQRPLDELSDEDLFMIRFSKIPRLTERMNIMTFLGNFRDTVQLLLPQLNSVIAASMSLKSSTKLRQILEIVLAFGNYLNSSKRGAAYGFRLQSLDALLDMKSTDRKQTLLHYIVRVIQEKYPDLTNFSSDLHFLDKAGTASLDSVLQDVRGLQRGMELTRKEFMRQDDSAVLKDFLKANTEVMEKLQADSKTAQEAYESTVEYFGENPKTTPPTMFFPTFVRFVKAYKKAEEDIQLWKKQEAALKEEESNSPGKKEESAPKSPTHKARRQQMDLIAELKKKQLVKEPLIYEEKDGAIEDIITGLRTQPYRRGDTGRHSGRKRTAGQTLQVTPDISL